MANEEQLRFLKECIDRGQEGRKAWNKSRDENPNVEINLVRVDLEGANLGWADLGGVNLTGANLTGADLSETDLEMADLRGAYLGAADLWGALLDGANFEGARVGYTQFDNIDLSKVRGLETVIHELPSTIGIDTLQKSKGQIPIQFLRGCGVSEELIAAFRPVFLQPIQYFTCFISYSHQDREFVDRLYTDLQNKGIRCWLDREDLKIGDRWKDKIEEAIRFYDKLLLILSSSSIDSDWVEKEVEAALEKEHKRKKDVLFPIRLDQAVMKSEKAWAGIVRRSRHIGDFSKWKEYDAYQKSFTRLLRDLKSQVPN